MKPNFYLFNLTGDTSGFINFAPECSAGSNAAKNDSFFVAVVCIVLHSTEERHP